MGRPVRWREAMEQALYGRSGYFTVGPGSGGFRTSVTTSPLFLAALGAVVDQIDERLDRPDPLTIVDVGAGRGMLLRSLLGRPRVHLRAVELAPRPPDLPAEIEWSSRLPDPGTVTGLLLATEWLDNVPLDIAESGRYVLVDSGTGAESAGPSLLTEDARWAQRWWPSSPGHRQELGRTRDDAWAAAVSTLDRGVALTVDYGHTSLERPILGTLTGYSGGRQVDPVPDGSCDLTAHVAIDSVRAAGEAVAGQPAELLTQREALHRLGLSGARPPRELAGRDPAGYVRALASASQAAELTATGGLGDHYWLYQPVADLHQEHCSWAL